VFETGSTAYLASLLPPGMSVMLRSLSFCLLIGLALGVWAQTSNPSRQSQSIAVPTLVEERSGEIAFGLSAADFSVKDEGVEQRVELEPDIELRPISLLVVIQTGHTTASQLSRIARLDELLDAILTDPSDQAAVITFDGSPHLIQNFTTDSDTIAAALRPTASGNSRAVLFDALHTSVRTFQKTPAANQRIILLISGEHDHGSNASDTGSLVREISSNNVSIYSLSFSTSRSELLRSLGLRNPASMFASAMQRNAGDALAQLTGGDFYRFDSEKQFEDRVSEIANHIHNRYSLRFHPIDPQPGFHSLQVELRNAKANVVAARGGYWSSPEGNPSPEGGEK
jgi:VWFA-related protein